MKNRIILKNLFLVLFFSLLCAGVTYAFLSKEPTATHTQTPDTHVVTPKNHLAFQSSNPELYNIWLKAHSPTLDTKIRGILVNHHLLAGELIAQSMSRLATEEDVTVVLLSPDHFYHNKSKLSTSNLDWTTPFGKLQANQEVVESLEKNGLVALDPEALDQEHGLSNLVAFIKYYIPNASLVPLTVQNNLNVTEVKNLAESLFKLLPSNTIYVGSFDFSHYLPSLAADFHDELSLDTIQSFNYDALQRLDVDSMSGLGLLLRLLELNGAQNFSLFAQTNSAKLTANPEALETTSYITGSFSSGLPQKPAAYTLLVLPKFSETISSTQLEPRSKHAAFIYLERFFYGPSTTLAFGDVEKLPRRVKTHNIAQFVSRFPYVYQLAPGVNVAMYPEENCANNPTSTNENVFLIEFCNQEANPSITKDGNKLTFTGTGELNPNQEAGVNQSVAYAVGIKSSGDTLSFYLFPLSCLGRECKLLIGKERDIVLKMLSQNSNLNSETKRQLEQGYFQLKFK